MIHIRRKGIAIVETSKGIILVSGKSKIFSLPGGGAERWESRKRAAIRELEEETGLKTEKIKYLFKYVGNKWQNHHGKLVRNHTKVFLVKSEGTPKPNHEIKHIDFWKPGSKIKIYKGTKSILDKYLRNKSSHQ